MRFADSLLVRASRLLFRLICPRCLKGDVFGGLVRMNVECPVCGLAFEREAGYFLGAMYFSYGLAIAAAVPFVVAGVALHWNIDVIGWSAAGFLVVLSPWLFRTSRVLWLHMDQIFDAR